MAFSLQRNRHKPRTMLPIVFKKLFFSEAKCSAELLRLRHNRRTLQALHVSPTVWLVEDFLTEADLRHVDGLIDTRFSKFQRSFTTDSEGNRVYSDERTSKFVWLPKGHDVVIRNIERRAADMIGLPSTHVEPLQVVAYRDGQYFEEHHDMGTLNDDGSITAGTPRRLVTFFVYLNSLPQGEGHTELTRLGVSVRPARGSALLFCNVDSEGEPDLRALHRACPVHAPHIKIGMNIWVTDRDLQFMAAASGSGSPVHRKRKASEKGKCEA